MGNQDYDWIEWQNNAEYKNGYNKDDETIKMFWEVFHEFDIDHKKKFLLFLTGSDRVPIMGMKAIKVSNVANTGTFPLSLFTILCWDYQANKSWLSLIKLISLMYF